MKSMEQIKSEQAKMSESPPVLMSGVDLGSNKPKVITASLGADGVWAISFDGPESITSREYFRFLRGLKIKFGTHRREQARFSYRKSVEANLKKPDGLVSQDVSARHVPVH